MFRTGVRRGEGWQPLLQSYLETRRWRRHHCARGRTTSWPKGTHSRILRYFIIVMQLILWRAQYERRQGQPNVFRARLSVTLSVCVYVICISEENGSVVPVFTVQLSFNDDHIAPHGSDSCNTAHLQRCSAGKQRAEQPSS